MNQSNGLVTALNSGDLVLGIMVTEFRTPQLAMMLAATGVDFAVLDMEHGTYSYETAADIIAALRATRVTPLVRVAELRKECFTKALDSGACGILVPGVETVDQARDAVRFSKYAPLGERGISLRKAHTGFSVPNRVEYVQTTNKNTLVMIQVETGLGLANIHQLAQIEGIDLIFVGPADLAHSLSPESDDRAGQLVNTAIKRTLAVAKQHNRHIGIHMSDVTQAQSLIQQGVRLLTVGTDVSLFIESIQEKLQKMRTGTDTKQ